MKDREDKHGHRHRHAGCNRSIDLLLLQTLGEELIETLLQVIVQKVKDQVQPRRLWDDLISALARQEARVTEWEGEKVRGKREGK